jgi:hypothetical protein
MTDSQYLKISCPQCDGHLEYPARAGGTVVDCPHCGSPIQLPLTNVVAAGKSKSRVGWLAGMILVTGLVALALLKNSTSSSHNPTPAGGSTKGMQGEGSNALLSVDGTNASNSASNDVSLPTNTAPPEPKPVVKKAKSIEDLSIGTISLEKKQGSRLVYAVGTMKNNSEYQHFGVRVLLDLLDDQGLKIGSAEDYMGIMEPHKTWQIHAIVVNPKTTQVRLASIKEESE